MYQAVVFMQAFLLPCPVFSLVPEGCLPSCSAVYERVQQVASSFALDLAVCMEVGRIRQKETWMQLPENFEAVGRDLAIYCQSRSIIEDASGSTWLPPSVSRFGPTGVHLESDWARVQMGGGFYHYGYILDKDQGASTPESNIWHLRLDSEGFGLKNLFTFSTKPQERISRQQFIANCLANYDREIATGDDQANWYQLKIVFLLDHDMLTEARAACREMFKKLPNNWWANLTVALIDAEQDAQQSEVRLQEWIESAPTCSRYLCLAHYYRLDDRPVEAVQAAEKAIKLPLRDEPGEEGHVELRAASIAIYLYEKNQYATVVHLCDAVSPILEKGDETKHTLRALRLAAVSAQEGKVKEPAPGRGDKDCDPYYISNGDTRIDLEKLRGNKEQ